MKGPRSTRSLGPNSHPENQCRLAGKYRRGASGPGLVYRDACQCRGRLSGRRARVRPSLLADPGSAEVRAVVQVRADGRSGRLSRDGLIARQGRAPV